MTRGDEWNLTAFSEPHRALDGIEGAWLCSDQVHPDDRGHLRKSVCDAAKETNLGEVFWSSSSRGVLRGMHVSRGRYRGSKLVSVLAGRVLDAVVDLRPGSGLGRVSTVELSWDGPSLLIPAGVAHGFQVVSDEPAIVLYLTSNVYDSEHDTGVNPLTCPVAWPLDVAQVSKRDLGLPSYETVVADGGLGFDE